MSYTEIGRVTGLSTSAVQQRVRKLEQRGIITGYAARVSNEALGLMLMAFVRCRATDPAVEDQIPDRLAMLPGVVSCYSVVGESSFLVRVLVATPADLEALLSRIRRAGCATVTELVLSVNFEDKSPIDLVAD